MSDAPRAPLPSGVVTLLLTDIEGSTPLWEQQPTAMAEALSRHDALLTSVVASHGGQLLRTRGEGDATFSVFARATDAAAAAMAAQRAIGSEPWPEQVPLRVRMAINTGETDERGGDYNGTVVNRAARLRGLAHPGQILVSQATADVLMDHLDGAVLDELGEQSLRGLSRSERVYALIPCDAAPDEPSQGPLSVALPAPLAVASRRFYVGRSAEMQQLTASWEQARAGATSLLLVAGEPGIGKTRIAAQLAEQVQAEGATVLFGRCDEDLGVPYQPFVEAFTDYATHCPRGALRADAGNGAGHLARLVPAVGELLPGLSARVESLDADRYAMFEACSAFLARVADRAPVLLVIDDLHWATQPTLLLLRHLLRAESTASVLVVATYRNTDVARSHPLSDLLADLRREARVGRLQLAGLGVEDVGAFVAASAEQDLDETGRELAQVLHAGTEGNPFFMSEVLRHLVTSGAATRTDGRWQTNLAAIEDSGIPESVRDVVSRRLSSLPAATQVVLVLAAVIGTTFTLQLMESMEDANVDQAQVLDALDEAVSAGVLTEGSAGYTFSHALIRQTLYAQLGASRRARLHRRIGEALERLPAGSGHAEALAYHFAEAGADGGLEKAASYGLAAGRRSLERLAYEEAIAQLDRGLEALELSPLVDPEVRGELLLAVAETAQAVGDRERCRTAALAAAEIARTISSPTLLARLASLLTHESPLGLADPEVATICEEALAGLDDQDLRLRARVMASLARYRSWASLGGQGTTDMASDAVQLARQTGDEWTLASVLILAVYALSGSPLAAREVAMCEEAVGLARKLEDPALLVEALAARTQARIGVCDTAGADSDMNELVNLVSGSRSTTHRAVVAAMQIGRILAAGRLDEVEVAIQAMQAIDPDDPNIFNFVLGQYTYLRWDQGRHAEVIPMVEASLPDRPRIAGLRAFLAAGYAQLGDLPAARGHLEDLTAADFALMPRDTTWPNAIGFLSEAAALLGDVPKSELLYQQLLPYQGLIVRVGRLFATGTADRFLGVLTATMGRWERSEEHFEAALVLDLKIASPSFQARTEYWYARMLVARDHPGDAARARDLAHRALTTAASLGMAAVASDARKLVDALASS